MALDQVESGDFLGHGVLDLEPRVGLDEGEVVVRVCVDEELEGAEIGVGAGRSQLNRCLGDSLTKTVAERRGGSDLDQFLIAALDCAFALADMGDVAVLVADDLDLDVPGSGDEALDEEGAVAECGLGLARAALEGVLDLGGLVDRPHPTSAASADRLDHHRRAIELIEEGASAVEIDGMVCTGQDWHAAGTGERPGPRLVAEQRQRSGGGSDERDAGFLTGPGEVCVLGEESVARMDGVALMLLSTLDDLRDVEICGGTDSFQRDHGLGVLVVVR